MRLRNAPTKLMKNLGYGKGYRYAHDEEDAYAAGERYLPDDMPDARFYEPTDRGARGDDPRASCERAARARSRCDDRATRGRRLTGEASAARTRRADRIARCSTSISCATTSPAWPPASPSAASRSTPRASRRSKRERKDIQTRTQELQAKRNTLSKQIGIAKGKGEDAAPLLAEVAGLGDEVKRARGELDACRRSCATSCSTCRTSRTRRTPVGTSADDNVEVRRWGTPRTFDFPVKDHVDLGEGLGLLDFATAAKLSGARFSLLRGDLARLHRALAQFMLDMHTREHGYTECYTPYIVNAESLVGTTQLPKFEATCSR